MKITITYKDDVFTVYKDGKESYTRKELAVATEKVNVPLSVAFTFLLLVEGYVNSEDVDDAIACLEQAGFYEFEV